MNVSVVVPTRDRPQKLERCLAALGRQAEDWTELVVVDDGSADAEQVAAVARGAGARLIRLEGRGPAAARNAGADSATGDVICFTDDDCEPALGWVAALAAPILSGEARCAAGRTVAGAGSRTADRAWQAIVDCLQRAATAPDSPSPGFAPSCNLGCSRELIGERHFDESFPSAAGEDRDWAARAAARGAVPVFAAAATVVHRPGLSVGSFLRQQDRYGRGAARFRATSPGRGLGSTRFYAGLLRAGFAAGPLTGALVVAAQVATAAGILHEHMSSRR